MQVNNARTVKSERETIIGMKKNKSRYRNSVRETL